MLSFEALCLLLSNAQPEWKTLQVQVWDLRKTSGAASFGATGPRHHTMVASLNVFNAVRKVAALIQETSIPSCSLQRLLLDPLDPTQAAFYLSCGWAGNQSQLNNDSLHSRMARSPI